MKNTKLKFKLPVGAVFGGCIHLGNGEFVGQFLKSPGEAGIPFVLEGITEQGKDFPSTYDIEVYDDPLDSSVLERHGAMGKILINGREATELELAASIGMDEQEYKEFVFPSSRKE